MMPFSGTKLSGWVWAMKFLPQQTLSLLPSQSTRSDTPQSKAMAGAQVMANSASLTDAGASYPI